MTKLVNAYIINYSYSISPHELGFLSFPASPPLAILRPPLYFRDPSPPPFFSEFIPSLLSLLQENTRGYSPNASV
jgi:hypothetical protein